MLIKLYVYEELGLCPKSAVTKFPVYLLWWESYKRDTHIYQ